MHGCKRSAASFVCFVINSLCHWQGLPRRGALVGRDRRARRLSGGGSRLPRRSFMRRLEESLDVNG